MLLVCCFVYCFSNGLGFRSPSRCTAATEIKVPSRLDITALVDWASDTKVFTYKVPSVENPEVTDTLPLKPGTGQNVSSKACFIHPLPGLSFFVSPPSNSYLPGPFTFIIS